MLISPFIPDSVKSKLTDKFSKIHNWVELKNKQYHSRVLLNSFPKERALSKESNVRKLCISQGFTLGVKWLKS